MATPLGHALAGVMVGSLAAGRRPLLGPWKDVLLFAAVAQAPDLDFLPGLAIGSPEAFHHGISHSLGFALLMGLVVAWLSPGPVSAWRWGLVGALIYAAQVVLDAWTMDTSLPYGVPIWWPLSGAYFYPEHPVLMDIWRKPLNLATLWHNLWAAGLEVLLLGPLTALAAWWRMRIMAGRRQGES